MFLCVCIYISMQSLYIHHTCVCVYTYTQSFCDFQRLLGDLYPPAVCFQVLIPDPNKGRENTKYYDPGNIGSLCHSSSGKL